MELSALAPFVFSALLCMGISPVLIPYLHRLKFAQTIRENGPTWHNAKGKTPTMGGLAFVAGTTAGVLLGGLVCLGRMPTNAVLVLLCALSFGFVGFVDDYIKVVKKRNLGLTPAQKLVLQVLAAAAFLWAARIAGWTSTALAIPFWNKSIELSLLYYPVAAVIVIGTVNAVNLTDGLDGLASCVTLPVALLFAAIGSSWATPAPSSWAAPWRRWPFWPACRCCWPCAASSMCWRPFRTSCRWATSGPPAESAFSKWRRFTTTLSCAA